MNPPYLPEATLIETQDALDRLAEALHKEALLGIDTESNSMYAYYERVCLIQISTRTHDYVIDPLALDDLYPLAPLMEDPHIEKIFHAAGYDIACLKRDFEWRFVNLFDTLAASRILGRRTLGLGVILEKEFSVKADKRYQRSNWGERPLSVAKLRYAQMDTHYLPALRDRLAAELQRQGHWEEALEAFAELTYLPAAPVDHFAPEGYWRIGKSKDVPRAKMALLRELYLLRDRIARRKDQPPFKIFGDNTLAELAREAPDTLDALRTVRGMSAGQVRRYGQDVLSALRRGAQQEVPHPPKRNGTPPDVLARYDALRTWRRDRGVARGVESDVIISRDALWALAEQAPQTLAEIAAIDAVGPWKRGAYGEDILRVLRNADSRR